MKYFFAFLAAVGLIIVVFILIVRGFSGGNKPAIQTELIDYAQTDTFMRMTVEGRVNANQDHRSAVVTVGRTENTINLIEGYEGAVAKTENFDSNEAAYATFLRALDLQGYTKGNTDPAKEDSRGYCPTGNIYRFEIITGSATVQDFWTSSCGGGTFRGSTGLIRTLFRAQIPGYNRFIAGNGLQ